MLRFSLALVCIILFTVHSTAQKPTAKDEGQTAPRITKKTPNPAMAQKIDELLAMPGKERKTYLKGLKPEERRGLWRQLKREKAARKGLSSKKAAYGTPFAIDVDAAAWTNRAVGSIVYDNGFPNAAFAADGYAGNHFNTHTGIPVFANGSVTSVQALVIPGPILSSSNASFIIAGPQTTMGNAPILFTGFTSVTGLINTVTFPGLSVNYTGSSFFVLFGDFASSYIPVFGPGTTMGQGHHAVAGTTGGMRGTSTVFNISPLTGLNSFIRASGDIVPVELMKFEVE